MNQNPNYKLKQPLPLGRIVATLGVLRLLAEHQCSFLPYLQRHAFGDWGDIEHEDKLLNDHAVRTGERVLSNYKLNDVDRIWIITEHDRSVTTMLLPEEY